MSRSTIRRQSPAIASLLLFTGIALGSHAPVFAAGGGTDGADSLLTAPSPVDFGRVLQGQAASKSVSISNSGDDMGATYSVAPNPANTGLTVTADGAINPNASENITFNLQTNSNGSGSTGSKSINVALDNTSMGGAAAMAADMGMAATPATGNQQADVNIAALVTVVANRDLTGGATAALGRVMVNANTASVNTTISGGSADDNNATRVNVNNGAASSGGVTVTRAGGTQLIDSANETASVGVVGNFSTTGAKSGSVNAAALLSNGESSITGTPTVDSSVLVNYSATAVANRDLSGGAAVNFGRMMINQDTSSVATTISGGSADDNNATRVNLNNGSFASGGVTVTRTGGTFLFDAANESAAVGLVANFSSAGLKSGSVNAASLLANGESAISGTVTVDSSVLLNYTATALANRNLDQQGGPVNLGNVLVGVNSATQIATITGGTADDDHQTRVTLGNGSVTQNGVTVSGGAVKLFNDANQTTTRNVVGNFSTSGAKSGVVNLAGQLSNSEDGSLKGTVSLDNTINVAYTANAYDAASLGGNAGATLGNNGTVSITNASGSFRSAAYVDSVSVTGAGWSVSNLTAGTTINAGGNSNSAHASVNDTGYLNGYVMTGNLSVTLENNQTLTGAANQDLGTLNWNLAHTVVGESGVQMAPVGVGGSYANLYGTSDQGLGTNASFLGGTNSNGPATTLETSWRTRTSGETYPYNMVNPLVSDVVSIDGSHGDTFVLELSYSESQLSDFEANLASLGLLYLAWFDGAEWVNAIEGNSGVNTTNVAYLNYQGSWLDSGAGLTLGAWGVNTLANRVWAVINHNSDFAVLNQPENFDNTPVPEPSTGLAALLGLASFVALRRYRRQRAK